MDSVSIMGSMLGSVITDRKLRLAEVLYIHRRQIVAVDVIIWLCTSEI